MIANHWLFRGLPLRGLSLCAWCCGAWLALADVVSAEPPLVRACDNDQDYPPFRWRETDADGHSQIRGLGYTLIRSILAKHGWRLELELLPLKRCLQEVATGKKFQLLINSSPNLERNRIYLTTAAFDYVSFHAFYLRSRFPEQPPVTLKRDLLSVRVCGIAGHNFSMFGVPAKQIDMGAENFAAAFQMLRSGRCDVLPYNLDAILGLSLVGQNVLADDEFAHTPLLDVERSPLVMLLAKPHRHSRALKKLIDTELAAMKDSGELAKLQAEFRQLAEQAGRPELVPEPVQ